MITLITGPMRCGKSTRLFERARRLAIGKRNYVVVRPEIDTRETLVRNQDKSYFKDLNIKCLEKLTDITNPLSYEYILIDEFQFFPEGSANFVYWLSLNGVKVILSALNATSEQEGWTEVDKIFHHADEIVKLNAICTECGCEHATYSYYNGTKTDKIAVGDEAYLSLCRSCLEKYKKSKR